MQLVHRTTARRVAAQHRTEANPTHRPSRIIHFNKPIQ